MDMPWVDSEIDTCNEHDFSSHTRSTWFLKQAVASPQRSCVLAGSIDIVIVRVASDFPFRKVVPGIFAPVRKGLVKS